MRILVLQLARFGDVYQSWPTLKALQRTHPDCELHVLVRARFQEAAAQFPGIVVHALPTAEILRPILEGRSENEAHLELVTFLETLADRKFNKIINLSFSPASSYITDFLATPQTEVRGYTRHVDGHLQIPDDTSAYFYAQVGVGKANRYHVTEIFASIAGVDLSDADFTAPEPTVTSARQGIVVHLGASRLEKTYSPEHWVEALRKLAQARPEKITLIGSQLERPLSETVTSQLAPTVVNNQVGLTSLSDLFQVIQNSRLLIGADSAPIHIASLAGTPVLNLSSASVNFWETGPLSAGSRILYSKELHQLSPTSVATEALAMLNGEPPKNPCIVRESRIGSYTVHGLKFETFPWALVQALYTGSTYPEAESSDARLAFQRLFELTELALQQLGRWGDIQVRTTAGQILLQVDSMLSDVARLNPHVDPVVQWFETQRLRIPPGSEADTLALTKTAFEELFWVTSVYRQFGDVAQVTAKAIALCHECIPEIRDYNLAAVSASFQTLVSNFHELARHSTKVAGGGWSSVVDELNASLERRDYIQLADFLEWKMIPALESQLKEKETLSQDMLS